MTGRVAQGTAHTDDGRTRVCNAGDSLGRSRGHGGAARAGFEEPHDTRDSLGRPVRCKAGRGTRTRVSGQPGGACGKNRDARTVGAEHVQRSACLLDGRRSRCVPLNHTHDRFHRSAVHGARLAVICTGRDGLTFSTGTTVLLSMETRTRVCNAGDSLGRSRGHGRATRARVEEPQDTRDSLGRPVRCKFAWSCNE